MSQDECIFCKISSGNDEKTTLLYEDDMMVVFKDIKPAATHHYLVVTKQHIKDVKQLKGEHVDLVQKLVTIGKQVLEEQGGMTDDVRLGFHWPPFTLVSHLHLHVISPTSEQKFMGKMIFRPDSWWFVTSDWVLNRLEKMKAAS